MSRQEQDMKTRLIENSKVMLAPVAVNGERLPVEYEAKGGRRVLSIGRTDPFALCEN
jgi:hypothetical protein